MNYASLNASLGPTEQKSVPKQMVSLTYNKTQNARAPTSGSTQTATSSNTPNTIMLRDSQRSTNISTINVASKLNVGDDATINGRSIVRGGATISGGATITGGATISGNVTINGLMKFNGTIDSSLGSGIVCSNSTGVLSTRQITSGDIACSTIDTEDIKNGAITTPKLAPNLFLSGTPTCNNPAVCKETQIANIGYVNRYVTNYFNDKIHVKPHSGCSRCSAGHHHGHVHDDDENDNDSCFDEDKFDPTIFHIIIPSYVVAFNYATYVVENSTVDIKMPRVKKEGYFVKFHNKSGDVIFINSDSDRLMYNSWYSPNGTTSQVIENNRCVIFTYVYAGTVRSWSYQCF